MMVSEMPKYNSAKLTVDNRVYLHPVCECSDRTFEMLDGWVLLGWSSAPFPRATGEHRCIVYEKLTPEHSGRSGDAHYSFAPGVYWGHGNPTEMDFRLREQEVKP